MIEGWVNTQFVMMNTQFVILVTIESSAVAVFTYPKHLNSYYKQIQTQQEE